jgi:hypothetical protein
MSAIIERRTDSAAEEREWELRCDMAAVLRLAARAGSRGAGLSGL